MFNKLKEFINSFKQKVTRSTEDNPIKSLNNEEKTPLVKQIFDEKELVEPMSSEEAIALFKKIFITPTHKEINDMIKSMSHTEAIHSRAEEITVEYSKESMEELSHLALPEYSMFSDKIDAYQGNINAIEVTNN